MKKILIFLKKYSLIFSLVIVVGIIVGGQFFNKKISVQTKKMEEEIKTKYNEIKKYETEKEKAPSPELIGKLNKKKAFFEKQFELILTSFSTRSPEIPQFTRYPAIEFKEYVYAMEDKLQKMARKRNVVIPSSFGFPKTGLVDVNQISIYTVQFEIIKDLIRLVLDSGVTMVSNPTPGVPQKIGGIYEAVPIKLTITGTSNEIMRCMKYFDNPSSYFVVENISVTNVGEDLYRVDLDLNAVIIEKKKEKG